MREQFTHSIGPTDIERQRRFIGFIGSFFAQRAGDESARQIALDVQAFAEGARPEELSLYLADINAPGCNPYQTGELLHPRVVIEQDHRPTE